MHTQKDQLGSEGGERQSGHQTVIRFYWIKAGAKVSRQSVTDQTIRKEMEGGENGCHERVEVKKKRNRYWTGNLLLHISISQWPNVSSKDGMQPKKRAQFALSVIAQT